jgi:glycosyltransferase involved in cell wall biosynthesis
MNAPSRNQPCPCGSGKRYKDCCGSLEATLPTVEGGRRGEAQNFMDAALAAQHARRLDEAERLYRAALAIVPDEPDALHMLGVVRFERDDFAEARTLIVRALELTGWKFHAMRSNLGLVLARESADVDPRPGSAVRQRYREWLAARKTENSQLKPLVSVVIPSYNHARYVEQALASVFGQSYRNVEIIVIDDGSRDDSAKLIGDFLRGSPFPCRFIARENRGAAATINEGLALAGGDYVNVLNSDDWFHADRLATMVAAVAGTGSEWGFSAVNFADGSGSPVDPLRNRRVFDLTCAIAAIPFRETVGFSLLATNVSVSTGNLFIARGLLEKIGPLQDFRYNHDWDFCLRAVLEAEPVFVPQPLYFYRVHEKNTIAESGPRAQAEAREVCSKFLRAAMSRRGGNAPFAPTLANWGLGFVNIILAGGMGALVDESAMREFALNAIPAATHGMESAAAAS